ncbi:MAG: hypothetical protein DMD28_06175 [Gemmatimonadetes bacterium]|nr:MAG: hypothetical protein DMD28_06175 [Gemmatimonadota bacterium]
MASACVGLLLALQQLAIPSPRGFVNDFAGVLDPGPVARMEAEITEVREKTRGDIVVVTLPDIGQRAPVDVAVEIYRQWRVGGTAEAGDPARNLGALLLIVPRRNHRPGTGRVFLLTGRGAEGFLPDARAGRTTDAMTPELAREDYGAAAARGVDSIAHAFADAMGVTLTSQPERASPGGDDSGRPAIPVGWLVALIIFLLLFSRGRILWLPFWLGGFGGGRGGWGGWSGGGGGGFGGGFGGFGGGGGTSGGGAGRSF